MKRINSKLINGLQLIALVSVFQVIVATTPQTVTFQAEINAQSIHQAAVNGMPTLV